MSAPPPSPLDDMVQVANGSFRVAAALKRLAARVGLEEAGARVGSLQATGTMALVWLARDLRFPRENLAVLAVLRGPLPRLENAPFHFDHLPLLFEFTDSDGTVRPIDDDVVMAVSAEEGSEIVREGHLLLADAFRRHEDATSGAPGPARDYWTRHGPEHLAAAGEPAYAAALLADTDRFVERLRLVGVDRAWPDGVEFQRLEALLERYRDALRRRPEAWPSLLHDACVDEGLGAEEMQRTHRLHAERLPLRLARPRERSTVPVAPHEPRGPIVAVATRRGPGAGPEQAVAEDGGGSFLLAADPHAVALWDLQTGRASRRVEMETVDIALSRGGEWQVAAEAFGAVAFWRSDSSAPQRFTPHADGATCVAFSADGTAVVTGGRDGTVAVFDADGPRLARTFAGHRGSVLDVAWSGDGKEVVSAGADGEVRVWSLDRDEPRLVLSGGGAPATACHSFAFGVVAGFEDGTLRMWNGERGVLLRDEEAHRGAIRAIATASGTMLFTASDDRTIRVSAQGAHVPTFLHAHAEAVTCLAVADRRLYSGSTDHTVIEWDLDGLAPRRRFGSYGLPRGIAEATNPFARPTLVLRSGIRVVSGPDGRIGLVSSAAASGREARCAAGVSALSEGDGVLFAGTDAGAIEVFSLPDLAPRATLRGHRRRVNGLGRLTDRHLLSWSLDATLRVWDSETGKCVATTHGDAPFTGVDLDPPGNESPARFTAEDADGTRWPMLFAPEGGGGEPLSGAPTDAA